MENINILEIDLTYIKNDDLIRYNKLLENMKIMKIAEYKNMSMLEIKYFHKRILDEYNELVKINKMARYEEETAYEKRLQNKEGICDKCKLQKNILYHNVHSDDLCDYVEGIIGCKECIMKAFET